jgi:hypothetical protein
VCTVGGTTFSIAAKRVKSGKASQIDKHIRKAADQIKRAGLPGVVALDVSLARNPENQPIKSQVLSQMYVGRVLASNYQFFDEYHQDINRWVSGTGVRGVLVFDFAVRLRLDRQWGLDGMMSWLPTTHGDDQAEREYVAFCDGFLRGVPNLEDLTAEE